MSENTHLNAVLALLEGRPELARAYLRAPSSNITSITDFQARVYKSMEILKCQAVRQALREILKKTVLVQPTREVKDMPGEDAFFLGLTVIEDMLTELVHTCEKTETELCS